MFMDFCTGDQARYQLLFTRAIPGFEPSADSYAIAVKAITTVRSLLADAGLRREADFDLWTSLTAGLASQQLANDPGGDRYSRPSDSPRPGRPERFSSCGRSPGPTRGRCLSPCACHSPPSP